LRASNAGTGVAWRVTSLKKSSHRTRFLVWERRRRDGERLIAWGKKEREKE